MAFVKWKTSSTYHIPTMYGHHLKFPDGKEIWGDGAGGPASMACGRKAPSDSDYVSQLPEGGQICTGCVSGPGVAKKDPQAEQTSISAAFESRLKANKKRESKAARDLFGEGKEQ